MNRLVKSLMKKDLLFSIKLLPISLICAIVLPIYGGGFAHNILATPLVMLSVASILAVLFYLAAICYLEDNPETEGLLCSLPLAKQSWIFARYAVTLLLILAALIVTIAVFAVSGGEPAVSDVIWTAAILLAHYGVFLYVFYKAGLQTAQYVPATILLAGAVGLKTGMIVDLNLPVGGYEYGGLAAAAVLFLLSAKYSAEE
ncbi:Uncharacterised protein [uncultured Eubacterium sp.]|nr:Uncharacterised protein [uncultured Eubacterium sp.]